MLLITSLVRALVKADGDAIVLDSGLKPYMVAGGVEMAIDTLLPAVDNVQEMINELLPLEQRQALDRLGALTYELPPIPALPTERLTLVVVRADPSVWLEIRRDRAYAREAAASVEEPAVEPAAVEPDAVEPAAIEAAAVEPAVERAAVEPVELEAVAVEEASIEEAPAVVAPPPPGAPSPPPTPAPLPPLPNIPSKHSPAVSDAEVIAAAKRDIERRDLEQKAAALKQAARQQAGADDGAPDSHPEESQPPVITMRAGNPDVEAIRSASLAMAAAVAASLEESVAKFEASKPPAPGPLARVSRWVAGMFSGAAEEEASVAPSAAPAAASGRTEPPATVSHSTEQSAAPASDSAAAETAPPRITLAAENEPGSDTDDDLSLPSASELWPDAAQYLDADDLEIGDPFADPVRDGMPVERPKAPLHIVRNEREASSPVRMRLAAIDMPAAVTRLLQMAAKRGATSLHLMSQTNPALRVQGEMQFLDEEPPWGTEDLEALLLVATPFATQKGSRLEWVSEVPEVGRVLCSSVREHRGVTATFGLPAAHGLTAEDLGLPPEVQALALEREGLILVTGARSSDKSHIITAFVDLVNRLRRDYVVTLEHEIHLVHQPQGSVISQREVRGGDEALLAAARSALEENPDVIAFDDLRSDAVVRLALKAAGAGHLVIAGLSARTATGAIETVLGAHPIEDRPRAQALLAEHLCGVVTQTIIRQPIGPGVIAREVLLNTPSVAKLIAAGRTSQLAAAIEEGRSSGMVSLDQTLLELVRSSAVDIHEAYRRAGDRAAFLEVLQREGIDTSILEPPR